MSHKNTPQPLTFDEKVYQNYRAVVTSFPRSGGYPAQGRQAARQAVVEKFGISFAEVKRIVKEQDAVHGITHDKPVRQTPEQEVADLLARFTPERLVNH